MLVLNHDLFSQMEEFLDLGLDGYFTDFPLTARYKKQINFHQLKIRKYHHFTGVSFTIKIDCVPQVLSQNYQQHY